MRYTKLAFSLIAVLALSACAGTEINPDLPAPHPKQEIIRADVVVATGCIDPAGRPDQVVPLNQQISREEWLAKPVGAKTEAVKGQAGDRMNYEDKDRAATAGCK